MRRAKVIELLKQGGSIVAVAGAFPGERMSRGSGEFFGATVRYDTVQWLEKSGLVDTEQSKTSIARYLTWKEQIQQN